MAAAGEGGKRRYTSCALLGNSGTLCHPGTAEKLLGYDRVVRTNFAPLRGLQSFVGGRADIMFASYAHFLNMLRGRAGGKKGKQVRMSPASRQRITGTKTWRR